MGEELDVYWKCRKLFLTTEPWTDPIGFERLSKYIELCEGWYPGLKQARDPGAYLAPNRDLSKGAYSHRTITSKGSCYVKATHPMGPVKENWEWFQP
jgi:hypothetical protein